MNVSVERKSPPVSSQMALLHLRWQQMRSELLQPAAHPTNRDHAQPNDRQMNKNDYAAA